MKVLFPVARRLVLLCLVGAVALLASCVSPKNVPGAIFVKGVVRFVELGAGCWVLETGEDVREKTFYELTGDDIGEVQFNNAEVQLWIVPRPETPASCQVGSVAEIIDVVDVRKSR